MRSACRTFRFPLVTTVACTVATLAAVVQYTVPAAVPALQRDPGALTAGQWWRLVTPLLVQTLGWYQVLPNLAALALFGLLTEVLLGRSRWLVLAAGGTAGGQAAAYAWHDGGGGDSIAICGLAGGLAVALLAMPEQPPRPVIRAVVLYVVALAGWGLRGAPGAALSCLAVGTVLVLLALGDAARAERWLLAATMAGAVALTFTGDLHGASLTAGFVTMGLLRAARRLRHGTAATAATAATGAAGTRQGISTSLP